VNENKISCSTRLKSENISAWVDFFAIIIDITWRTYSIDLFNIFNVMPGGVVIMGKKCHAK
jgi:hypothetical protein